MLLRGLMFIFIYLFILYPCYSAASDAEILKRLEQMEKEINNLKEENAELRRILESDKKDKEAENERLKKMVETDRKEIAELKRSAGKIGSSGLRTVLGKYDMQIYGDRKSVV